MAVGFSWLELQGVSPLAWLASVKQFAKSRRRYADTGAGMAWR